VKLVRQFTYDAWRGMDAATKRYDEIDRKRRAYKEILDEIPAPPAPDVEQ